MNSNVLRARAIALALPLTCAVLLASRPASAEVPGSVYSASPYPATLDPDQNGWVSRGGAAFVTDDQAESEIPYIAIPQYGAEPMGDPDTGGNGGPTDMVDTNPTRQASFVYWDKGADGIADTADDKLLFRIRVGRDPNGAYGFSILIDTDARFGTSGATADPNAVSGNPGFEVEIITATGGSKKGVNIYNVDGTTNGSLCASYGLTTNSMRSYALTNVGGSQNVFLDFFVPLRQLTTCFGITSTSRLRLVAATSTSPSSALGTSASDIGGVPDNDPLFWDNDAAFFQAASSSPPVTFDALGVGGGFDTTPPETTIATGPAPATNAITASFTFSSNEAPVTYECRLDGAVGFSACPTPASFNGLAEGPHSLEVRAIDAAFNVDATPATWSWSVDLTPPPQPVITAANEGATVGALPVFSGTAEPGGSVTPTLDGRANAPVAVNGLGQWTWMPAAALANGAHLLRVTAADAAGNTGLMATRNFSVDDAPPDTLILSGPAANANSSSATFEFSSTKPGSSFECSRDNAAYAACTTPVTFNAFADGSHTFAVRAVDSLGNSDPSPTSWSWTVDTVAPDTSITAGPPAATQSTSATFSFDSNEPSVTFECRLDGAAFSACTTPATFGGLGEGSHTLEVRAKDAAGNADPTPATFSWTVDTLAPDTQVLIGPNPVSKDQTAGFQFGSNEAGVGYECSLDSAAFASCTNPVLFIGLGDGPHTLQVRARDAAGNLDATPAIFNWLVDTIAPDTTIAAAPPSVTNSNTANFTFTSNEAGVTYECRIDGWPFSSCSNPATFLGLSDGTHALQGRAVDAAGNADPTPAAWSWTIDTTAPDTSIVSGPLPVTNAGTAVFDFGSNETGVSFECSFDSGPFQACSDPATLDPLSDGMHTLRVRAKDAAGNVDASPAQFTWTVDRTPPDTTIVSGPASPTVLSTAGFSFSSDELGVSYECRLDGGAFAACANPLFLVGVTDGSHTLQVRARDAAGNLDPTPASYGWVVDTGAPDTTILSGPARVTTATAASFTFESNELGSVFECRLDGAAFAACTSPRGFAGLLDGGHTFEVRARDGAGNLDPTPATYSWTVDTTSPDTFLVSAPPALTNSRAATFDFASNEAGASYECRLDGGSFGACADPTSYAGLADGSHTFEVRARDAAGNVDPTPLQYTWSVDATAPDTTLLSGPPAIAPSASATFDFSSNEAGATFQCSLDGAAFQPCANPATFNGLGDGPHTLAVRARDAAGNLDATPATWSWTADITPPQTTIAGGPASRTNSTSATITFSSNEPGSTFECAVDGASFSACASPLALAALAEGDHGFQVRAKDAAGNYDPTPASLTWTVDLTAPETHFVATPPADSAQATATFDFSSTEAGGFECRLDGASFAACSRPLTLSGLSDGSHTFQVRARDLAGNTDATPASYSWNVDTSAPDTTIVSGPAAVTNATSASFGLSSSEPGASFECSLDGAAFAACANPAAYAGLGEGTHSIQVRARDAAGNVDPTPATRSWTVDLTAPNTTLDSGPASPTNATTAGFTFSSNEPGSAFECSLDGASFGACSSPLTLNGLGEGGHTFQVRAIDVAGNVDATPASFGWTIDLTAPETTILSGPATPTAATSATFTFSASEPGSFECRLDGASFAACTTPATLTGLADGSHTFQVRAKDAAGNLDPSPASFTWTVDTAAPETTIVSGPAAVTNLASASFALSASEAGSTFECSLDGAAFGACANPAAYAGLGEGNHTFQARAKDASGNVDATPAGWAWRIDLTAPETTINSGPASPTNATTASFTFSATEPGSFECSLDGAAFAACASPLAINGVSEGDHTFQVRAKDAAGNVDATPASFSWTVDLTAPETTILSGPANPTSATGATFTFSASEPGATFECRLDGAGFAPCTTPVSLVGLGEGSHTFQVRAKDASGNVDATPASVTWTVDVSAPDTTLLTGPAAVTNATAASFTFSSSEPGTFECSLDGAAFAPCTTPATVNGLGEGSHTFQVRAKDAAGNLDPTPASRTWTVDLTAPETTIDSGPSSPTASTSASFTFSSTESGSFECSLDGAAFAACGTPLALSGLAEGIHTLRVRARDAAGNLDATPASFSWTIDLTPPETTILTGPATPTAATAASFTFSATKAGSTFECRLDGAAFAPCSTPASYAGLAEGSHTFQVRATDSLGNVDPTPASYTWTVDVTAPDTSILSGPALVTNATTATLTFSATEPGTFECSLDGAAFAACTTPASLSGLVEGSHTFRVRAKDAAGNLDATPASYGWTVDLTAPETTLVSTPSTPTASTSASFDFTSEPGATFECRLDGASFGACGAPVALSGLAEGSHTFQVRARDAAGNVDPTPASFTWTIDLTAPETTILTGPTNPTSATAAAFTFSASEPGAAFECSLDGAAFAACTTPANLGGLAEGSHTFQVRARDASGNVDATPASFTWAIDLTAPETTILTGPTGVTNATAASFTFSATEPGSFECSLDGAPFAACATPANLTGLAEGGHTFQVRAKDAAGNTDGTPASRTWTVDTAAPDTTLVSTPATPTNQTAATFAFTSEPGATFECSLDGAAFAACSSPATLNGLAEGSHTFQVRAKDAAGNVDPTPASFTWTVDLTAPETTITSNPAALTNATTASFAFSASEIGSTFECKLDGAAFAACTTPVNLSGLAGGSHTFQVRARDAAGNTDATPASYTWTVDLTAPETSIVSGPPAVTNATSATFDFGSDDAAATFECKLDSGSFAACTDPVTFSGLTEGSHTLQVRAKDAAGNVDATPASATWTVDRTAPETTITSNPTTPTNATTATFTFSSSETGSTFQCKVDSGSFAACSTPFALSGLTDGSHAFQVRATDAAGNTDATPASFTWTVDTAAPDTTLVSTPTTPSNSTSAAFDFSSNDASATFECKLDAGSFAACTHPTTFSGLTDGSHAFQVRARDAAGNVDATPASFTWTVDTAAPQTSIVSGPAAIANSSSAAFDFSSDDAAATFECKLDSGSFADCTDPVTFNGLSEGSHTLQVRARDAAGNVDATPATWSWTVDTTAPDTSIVASPTTPTSSTSAAFDFSSNDAAATFECKLDSGSFAACTDPVTFTGMTDGSHTLLVRARDAAGNVDPTPASFTWTVDTVAPDTTILTGPAAIVAVATATFTFSSSETGGTFECKLDAGSFAACTTPTNLSALAEGSHTYQVRAKDAAGNVDATPATWTWTVDTVAPDTTIVSGPATATSATFATFDLSSNETGVTYECKLDSGAFATCTDPATFSGLADGAHTMQVRAKDAAGNLDATPATWSWTVDTVAPDTTMSSGPASLTNSTTASFSFTSNETGATFECKLDAGAFAACTTPASYSGLADGSHTFSVRAKDAAGNLDPTPATQTWTVDATAPDTTIVTAPPNLTRSTSATFEFSSNETGATFECALDGGSFAACTTPATFSGLADGSHTLRVRAKDAAGNLDPTPATHTWTLDATAPLAPSIAVPLDGAALPSGTVTLSGHAEANARVNVTLDGAALAPVTADASGAWTLTPASVLADGAHAASATATDAAGNVSPASATTHFTVDTVAPDTSIVTAPAARTASAAASFDFASNESGVVYECSLDGAAFAACAATTTLTGLADGAHSLQVRARDAAGNVDATPATHAWTVDTTAPAAPVITAPAEGAVLATSTPAIGGTAEPGATVAVTIDGTAVATAATADAQGHWSITAPTLADGAHVVTATATDDVGNRSAAATPVHFNVLTSVPAVPTLDQPADGAFLKTATPVINGHAGAGLTVLVSIDGVEAGNATADAAGAWTFPVAAALADGPHALSAVARNGAGTRSAASPTVNVVVDTRPPETTDGVASVDPVNERTTFTFTCDEEGCTFECSYDDGAYEPCTSPLTRDTALGENHGEHHLDVRATDRAGNVDPTPLRIDLTVALNEESLRGAGCSCSSSSQASPWLPILGVLAFAFVRRRRRRDAAVAAIAAAVGLAALLPSAPARAQTQMTQLPKMDLERLTLNPDGLHSLLFGHGDVLPEGGWRLSLVGDYEHKPLTYYRNDLEQGVLVSRRVTAHLMAAWTPIQRLEIGLQLPVILNQAGDDLTRFGFSRPSSAGLGAPMLQARYGVLSTRAGHPFDLAAQVGVRTPLGSVPALGRDHATGFEIKAGANRRFGLFDAGLQLGTLLRSTQTVVGRSGNTLMEAGNLFDVGATLGLGEEDGPRAELDVAASLGGGSSSSAEVLAGGRVPVGPVEVFALAGPGLGQYPGTPAFRVIGGVGLRTGGTSRPVVTEKTEEAATDSDGDGIPDKDDRCPYHPGTAAMKGCPDRDGDGIADRDDACPDVAGDLEHKGCPPPAAVVTVESGEEKAPETKTQQVAPTMHERVHFAINSMRLTRQSRRALDAMIESLKGAPGSVKIVVEGHCDSTGSHEYNQKLSERRANAVKKYLVKRGVTVTIETVGYSYDKPIDTNATKAGRRNNRRAEFNASGDAARPTAAK